MDEQKFNFFRGIPRVNSFENQHPIGFQKKGKETLPDYLYDDSALVHRSEKGLFIITGCSHAGICNIVEYAKEVCKEDRIVGIIGGLHLLSQDEEQLHQTIQYLQKEDIQTLYPCHCVDLPSKLALANRFDVKEVGVGFEITL